MTIGRNGNRLQTRLKLAKARKLSQSRQALLESLESRQLMAVGPQLIAVQSNEGDVVSEGQILSSSPRELVFRFDDSSAIDPATLGGIQISRTGGDSAFDRAYVSTDLGTNGVVVMDFAAAVPGQLGNGTRVTFTSVSQPTTGVPILSVGNKSVNIQLNRLAGFKTTAQQILTAFQNSPSAGSVVIASILRGVPTTAVADTAPVGQTLTLTGANTAKASSSLNAGFNVQVDFTSSQSGASGLNTRIVVTSRNFGGPGLPNVSVVGQVVNVQVNSNVNNATRLGEFVDAINSSTAATQFVTARIASGNRTTPVGTSVISPTTLQLGGLNDVIVEPGFIGIGDRPNEVIVRFAERLPDDVYRIDVLGTGLVRLRDIQGQSYNGGVDTSRTFRLDLGALVQSVVPQPVVRNVSGTLEQRTDEIHVYFNTDNLNVTDAQDPAFYQLRYLAGSVDSNDDLIVYPRTAVYDAAADRVVLRFARNLDQFAVSANLPPEAMRLRVGSRVDANKLLVNGQLPDSVKTALVPVPRNVPASVATLGITDPGDRFATAFDLRPSWSLSATSPTSVILNSHIVNQTPYTLDFPGADSEPGNRKIRYQQHVTGVDADGIEQIEYNFQGLLGTANGSNQLNAITEGQKQIVRNILDLYENYLGVRFIETVSRGATIAVGDMRAVSPGAVNGVGGQTLISGNLLSNGQAAVVFDLQDSDSSTDNLFGTEVFRTFARGIGNLLGLGTADEVPGLTVQSNIPPTNPGIDTELVYPGDADIVYGQYMHRPESKDIDLYRFSIPTRGQVRIEVSAERLANSSLLDSALRLYRLENGTWNEVSANDDYFSEDSQIRLTVDAGEYIVGVSAKGNQTYDPNIADSGLGGRSEGRYQLRLDFRLPENTSLKDASGTVIDGDADGLPGGFFDFWFVPNNASNTIFVDKNAPVTNTTTQPNRGDGSLANPYNKISLALAASNATRNVVRILGNGGTDRNIATPADNYAYEVGFNRLGQVQADGATFDVPRNVTVMIDAGAIVKLSRARIGVGSTTVSADRSGGSLQSLGIPRFIDPSGRVVSDLTGNPVPGSVYFTSLNDTTVGIGSNRDTNKPAPAPGDWGGIDIRNQVDAAQASIAGFTRINKEAEGLFLNSIIHADLRFGGGSVVLDGVSQVITPVHMIDARPTVAYSLISRSADAALAATPNSFLESNFQDPASQGSSFFISDLERVGPDLRGNRLSNNSVNGLLVKTRTNAASTVEVLVVPGRFNDTDMVHVVSENLLIQGATGGRVAQSASPISTTVLGAASAASGLTNGLTDGFYRYRFTFVETQGTAVESPASEATSTITVANPGTLANGQIRLTGLPTLQPTQRLNIYRTQVVNGIEQPYRLVGFITSTQSSFTDTIGTLGTALPTVTSTLPAPILTPIVTPRNIPGLTGALASGTYRYQITYANPDGSESSSSLIPTDAVVVTAAGATSGRVTLSNLPIDSTTGAVQRTLRIYRATISPTTSQPSAFQLVGVLGAGVRNFIDNNASVDVAPPTTPSPSFTAPTGPQTVGRAPTVVAGSPGLSAGTYVYSLAFVNSSGAQSSRLQLTDVVVVSPNNATSLTNLPVVPANQRLYIYRAVRIGNILGPVTLTGVINPGTRTFTDSDARIVVSPVTTPNTTITAPVGNVVLSPRLAPNVNGSPSIINGLSSGVYAYRLTVVDSVLQQESNAANIPSTATVTTTTGVANGTIAISNLPSLPANQTYRIYRATVVAGVTPQYFLVASLPASVTSFLDTQATPGTVLNNVAGPLSARLNGSLTIDPGTVVKLQSARIEVQGGGQLLAEGTDGAPIIITSINDVRHGAGGTFDTSNRRGTLAPAAGNFGGIFIGQASTGSFDFVRLSYGGGTTRIEGSFASINAIEGHQAELRIANSRFENNASGIESSTPTNRAGRGTNFDGTIFVRGSQPIIVDNRISNNESAPINIDVNSLNSEYVVDLGRKSGVIQTTNGKDAPRIDNQGPLIAGNQISNNGINGMVVRGQTLTTASVWDDSDIVHVVRDEIVSSNLYTYGGLKLKSSSSSSLVVKFGGGDATAIKGLTATGQNLDISDRIGGSVQIVGVPNFPVILTALDDDSVGAGFTPSGIPVTDTDNNGAFQTDTIARLPTIGEVNRGITIDNDVANDVIGHFEYTPAAGGGASFGSSGITAQGVNQLFVNANVIFAYTNFVDVGGDGQAVSLANTTITLQPTLISPDVVASEGSFTGASGSTINWRVETSFENGISRLVNAISFSSASALGSLRFINYLDEDVQSPSDDFLFTTGTPGESDFRAFTFDGAERFGFSQGGVYIPGDGLVNATYTGWAADRFNLLGTAITGAGTAYTPAGNINLTNLPQFTDATLGTAFGPADVTTAFAWDVNASATSSTITTFLELIPTEVATTVQAGGWRGLLFESGTNDRNVAIVTERETARSSAEARNDSSSPSVSVRLNDSISSAQYLGVLASSVKAGDENARLGFEIQGVINRPSDLDVYSFNANGGTEVWFDIDRTSNSLDTVIELIDSQGNTLVLSDDSMREEANGTVTFTAINQATGLPYLTNSLRKSSSQIFPLDSRGNPKDLYGTNPKDAGFRVILPGSVTQSTLYHVRVRSSDSTGTGTAASVANLSSGRTKGAYQLQIRLSEAQEFPGSSVNYADIRYATTGIDLAGVPRHSPLLGESAERVDTATAPTNNTFATAQEIGNLLQTDRATLSIAGNLSSPTDVDWYTFTIDYQVLQTELQRYFSTVFDVDYADGIGRPDTSVYLFNSTGNLLSQGLNSNILDDRAGALKGADNTDLSRGSAGMLDPFLGPIELGAVGSTVSSGRYYVAVTNQGRIPTQIAAASNPNNGNPLLRLQPANNTQWIVEDRVGSVGGSTAQPPATTNFLPAASAAVPFSLGDVALYLSTDNGINGTNIFIANPMTGRSDFVGTNGQDVNDIAFRYNGDLRGFNRVTVSAGIDADAAVNYFHLNDATGVATSVGTLGLQTSFLDNEQALTAADVGFNIEAVAFGNFGFTDPAFGGPEVGLVVGNRPVTNPLADGVQSTRLPTTARGTNVVYRFNPNTGAVLGAGNFNGTINDVDFILGNGTETDELGYIDTTTPSGLPSRRLTFIDATTFNSIAIPPITTLVLNDGNNFVIQLPTGQTRVFEFDSGPEFRLTLNPTNGPFLADGSTFTLSNGQSFEIQTNSTPVQAGARPILYDNGMTNAQFATALQAAMNLTGSEYTIPTSLNNIGVGQDGSRFNLADAGILTVPALTGGSFANAAIVNITNPGSLTLNNPNAVRVTFLAQDSGASLAQKAATAISGQGFLGVSTTVVGDSLTLIGATITSTQGAIFQDQVAAGGTITGIAVQNVSGSPVFAISSTGGLYRVNTSLAANPGNIGAFVGQITAPAGTVFTGLTAGPRTLQDGQYANLLFATTQSGSIYAFNTSGALQPVFALGATSINTRLGGLNGLAFSTLDYNLFNISTQRGFDAGHGNPGTPDEIVSPTVGGQSWHFAYEGGNQNPNAQYDGVTNPSSQARFDAGPTTNTYNFPGGALGILESQPISLANIAAGDSPYFYFTYFSQTESAGGTENDLIRIRVIGDDGIWREIGNNDVDLDSPVIFNNSATQTGWKQARVNIGQFAGNESIRFRFEFSTGGGVSSDPGAEIRVIPGSQLRDGQTFTVSGTTFEINTGSTLTVPTGASIANNSTISVSGVTYTFRQGASTPSSLITDIFYSSNMSAIEITRLIATAISAQSPIISENRIQLPPRIPPRTFGLPAGSSFTTQISVNGPILTVPAGSTIANNSTISISGVAYTFRQAARAPGSVVTDIFYTLNMSAIEITTLIATAISAQSPIVSGNLIQLPYRTFVFPAGSSFATQGGESVTEGNVAVLVNQSMSSSQVAIAVRNALLGSIGNGSTYDIFPTREEFVSLPGIRSGVVPGPFTVNFPNPNLRQFPTVANPSPTNRLVNNAFEGIYLDDFVIGVAERGENVGGSSTDTSFVANPNSIVNSINVGAYQIEIRGGQEYGVPTQTGLRYPATTSATLTGINTRLVLGATVVLPNAGAITNGDRFTISDGNSSVLFVFSDTASPASLPSGAIRIPYSVSVTNPVTGVISSETASTLAARLRDILNSTVVQSRLKINAISLTGATTGASGAELALSSNAVVTVPTRPNGSTVITVNTYRGKGDSNTVRDQGQVIIENSKISDSAEFGILVRPDARDTVNGASNPNPGAVRNTVVLNTERLVPGAVIINNELVGNRSGGIRILGDNTANTTVPSSISFARVVNNTIVGGSISAPRVPQPQSYTTIVGGTERSYLFPLGNLSFVDSVVSYLPNFSNGPVPAAAVSVPASVVGVPDYIGGALEPLANQGAVSLGRGGRLVARFVDNFLTGSGDARPDLFVSEVGISERALVEVSSDGVTYTAVGSISGTIKTIDLDFYGFNRDSRLAFVRITDNFNDGAVSGETVGADIDAIGALSSVPATVFTAGGVGIDVGANASPTLLNNIVVNAITGLNISPSTTLNPNVLPSTATPVVGGMLFQRNTANVGGVATLGQFSLVLSDAEQLFQDPETRLFYPIAGARSIDSTIDSLLDRASLVAVKQPLGLDLSPVLAPNYDLNGLLRIDDPSVNFSFGTGQNVFKDRGAQDRSDSVGPSAVLTLPVDNSSGGGDSNPGLGIVQIQNRSVPYFEIRLVDGLELGSVANGSGVAPLTVSSAGVEVTRDDQVLIEGIDYRFGFDSTSSVVRLTPIAGVWTSDAVYRIRFINAGQSTIPVQPVAALVDGTTYVVLDSNGDFYTFELDLGIRLTVPTVTGGSTHNILDGSQFLLSDGVQTLTYEFDTDGVFATNSVPIAIISSDTPAIVSAKMVTAIRDSGLNALVNNLSSGSVQVLGTRATLVSNSSRVQVTGTNGVVTDAIRVPMNAAVLPDGSAVAVALANAIRQAALTGVTVTSSGRNVQLEGAQAVYGTGATVVGQITDRAGNSLRANSDSGDTTLTILLSEGFDYGSTSKAANGPRHQIVDGFQLGAGVSAEADAVATGADTFEDGVRFPSLIRKGYATSLTVTASGISVNQPGFLNAWIDYNRNGVYSDNERITRPGGQPLNNGINTNVVQFTVPGSTNSGNLNSRFRFSSTATLSPLGEATDGEVEEYVISVSNNPYQNPTNALDVNGDRFVSPIDALLIINYLNDNPNQFGTQLPPTGNPQIPFFLDVNGDGFVAPIDVLLVINELNMRATSQSLGGEGESTSELGTTWFSASPAPSVSNSAVPAANSSSKKESTTEIASETAKQAPTTTSASELSVASLDSLWADSGDEDAGAWLSDDSDSDWDALTDDKMADGSTVDGLFARLEGFGS